LSSQYSVNPEPLLLIVKVTPPAVVPVAPLATDVPVVPNCEKSIKSAKAGDQHPPTAAKAAA
jgi:hypothetical protein